MSFEVMCINDSWRPAPEVKDTTRPSFGEQCTVVEVKNDIIGRPWYKLKGYRGYFIYTCFAPLKGPDERKRLEAWQEEQAEIKVITDRAWGRVKANLKLDV
jgi:hypothetical protein